MKLHFVDKALGQDDWQEQFLAGPIADDGRSVLWEEAEPCDTTTLTDSPVSGATFGDLPAAALRAASYTQFGKDLATHCYQNVRTKVFSCDELRLTSQPGESEGQFRSRLALALREQRDAKVDALRQKFAAKRATLWDAAARDGKSARRRDSRRSRNCRR